MDRITVTPIGTKGMQARLAGMARSVQGAVMRPVVEEAARELRDLASEMAPTRTGALRKGIVADLMKMGSGYCYYWVRLAPAVYYGRFQEFGLGNGSSKGTSAKILHRRANYEQSAAVRRALLARGILPAEIIAANYNWRVQKVGRIPFGLSRSEMRRQVTLASGGRLQGQRRPNMAAQPFIRPAVRFTRQSLSRFMLEGIAANVLRWTTAA